MNMLRTVNVKLGLTFYNSNIFFFKLYSINILIDIMSNLDFSPPWGVGMQSNINNVQRVEIYNIPLLQKPKVLSSNYGDVFFLDN